MRLNERGGLTLWGRVEITGGFLLVMAWLNYWDRQNLLPMVLCAAAAHELGHLAAIAAVGGRVRCLRLTAAGAELPLVGTMGYVQELCCALAGPLVNLMLACGAARVGVQVFAGMNLALGLFNLLPLSMLDGGRALACLAALALGAEQGWRLRRCVDGTLCAALLLLGAAVLRQGGNMTLLIIAAWLMAAACKKE